MGTTTVNSLEEANSIQYLLKDAMSFDESHCSLDVLTLTFTHGASYDSDWAQAKSKLDAGAEIPALPAHTHRMIDVYGLDELNTRTQANLGFLPSNLANFELESTFQAGHGWDTTGSTGSFDANDTTNNVLGAQCMTITAAASDVKTGRNLALSSKDIAGKNVGILLKVDNVANISDISLYLGNNTTNFVRAQAIEGSQGASIFNDDEWVLVTLSPAAFDSVTGSPDLTTNTFGQLRIAANASGDCTVSCNGIFFFDAPSQGRVTISFDDGYESTATIAKVEMDKYMLPGVAYMVPEYMDDTGRLSKVQLDKMYEDGWEIGGHHISNDQRVDDEETIRATYKGIREWSDENGFNIKSYAYSGGEWGSLVSDATTTVRDIAKDYFETARVIFQGSRETLPPADPHKLRVLYVTNAVTVATVQAEIVKSEANGEWLHLAFHDIVETNADVTTKYLRSDFVSILDAVAASTLRAGTVEQIRSDMAQEASGGGSSAWGGITGSLASQTDLQAALDSKQDLTNAISTDAVGAIAAGSTLGLEQQLLAQAGQPARTVLAVGYTTTGKVQGVSLGDGNVIEVYANGADFNSNTVLYREFASLGEPLAFTGLSNGAIITASHGYYGFSECVDGADESPMPLLSYGLSFKFTFMFAFRNCQSYLPNAAGANQGWIHVVNGPLENVIKLANGSGVTVQGQENIALSPWQYYRLYTSGNQEYIIEGTNPIMACHNANMDLSPHGRFYDSRLIMPLTNDGITWPRSGFISAPFDNTQVPFYVRDGAQGTMNSTAGTGVSPGSPVDFDAAIGVGTGASDQDYEPDGATRVLAVGLISAYSGADSAGLEASPLMPTTAMSQVVAQPLTIDDTGDGGDSGVAVSSPYEGTAKVYEWNTATNQLDLAYTMPLTRASGAITTKEDQYHPSAGLISNDAQASNTLVGDLLPGVIIADVPITVVVQNGTPTLTPTIRAQNGTTTTGIVTQDDETLTLGWTPPELKAEIAEGVDGLLYKRVIDGGAETWVLA